MLKLWACVWQWITRMSGAGEEEAEETDVKYSSFAKSEILRKEAKMGEE